MNGDVQCVDVTLIRQKEYEGDKNFTLELLQTPELISERVNIGRATTQVVITDYSGEE